MLAIPNKRARCESTGAAGGNDGGYHDDDGKNGVVDGEVEGGSCHGDGGGGGTNLWPNPMMISSSAVALWRLLETL